MTALVDGTFRLLGDVESVLERTEDDFRSLAGARLFITGGTGFIGSWLLETLTWAIDRLRLDTSVIVLSRDPRAFDHRAPHLARHYAVDVVRGAGRTGSVDAVIHGATASGADVKSPRDIVDTIVDTTRLALDVAGRSRPVPFLLLSSGAVYGRQPTDVDMVTEDWAGAPDPLSPSSAYGEAKRLAENMGAIADAEGQAHVKIARLFAFIGPYLPLDQGYAAGNFLADALAGRPVHVAGDGTTVRSYLYASDLAAWLWRILVAGQAGRAYNVGSEDAVTIAELAAAAAALTDPPVDVHIAGGGQPGNRYVPSTLRARSELGLTQTVGLHEMLARTYRWHGRG